MGGKVEVVVEEVGSSVVVSLDKAATAWIKMFIGGYENVEEMQTESLEEYYK